jgi:hypothetical protein
MQVTVHLIDVLDATNIRNVRADITTKISALYNDCIAFANRRDRVNPPHTFSVNFATAKPAPADTDFICYFLPSLVTSVVAKFDNKSHDPTGESHWGFTSIQNRTQNNVTTIKSASEVIVKQLDGGTLGALVFHECLHAKLGLGNNMHSRAGLASAVVDGSTQLNDANRRDIADTINKRVIQWPDGWEILSGAKTRRAQGDDFWWQL